MRGRLVLALLATIFAVVGHAQQTGCSIAPATFRGWQAQRIANRWVTLWVVPQLGGRLMQVSFGPHSYLFVNPVYEGKYYPPSQGAALGKWFNYGGDKVWPLPEGSEDEQHWAGGSDILDDSPYAARVTSAGPVCTLRLEGPPDARTGLQYSRDISIDAKSPRIAFRAEMRNASAHAIEWSEQSVSQYDTADAAHPGQYNDDFWALTPANPDSAYLNRYHIRSGPAEHPSFALPDNLFTLHWMYLESEVWLDSPAGWVAVVDGVTRYAMVERFRFQPQATYPGKATVIFYINGQSLRLRSGAPPQLTPPNPTDTPYYMEAELNSPMVKLRPGESYVFETEWFPTRGGPELHGVTDAGAVLRPLRAEREASGGVRLEAGFGVFYAGKMILHVYDAQGVELAPQAMDAVSPLEPVTLDQQVALPRGADWISLHLEDSQHRDRGSLGECRIAGAAAGGQTR